MLARIHSGALSGIDAVACEVEVDVGQGGFERSTIVGLPDAAVKESIERVRSSITNSGFSYPSMASIINLAPADIRKEGPRFDLPIAMGFLFGQGKLDSELLEKTVVVGELALDGRVRSITGALATTIMAREHGFERILVPQGNGAEAGVVQGIDVYPVGSLAEAVGLLTGDLALDPMAVDIEQVFDEARRYDEDFRDVKGQEHAKQALKVAAAGNHNLLMLGPPGSGKTMLARRIRTILPSLTLEESLETTRIYSALGLLDRDQSLLAVRPFRSPHHSSSAPSLVGGGTVPRPGELSLAHHGVLFLDEFPEFQRSVLETIREPLEEHSVTIARASGTMVFPANILLIASMNPCPCGYLTDPNRSCKCSPNQVERYLGRLSGPLIDRVDIHVDVPAVPYKELASDRFGTSSADIRESVLRARGRQRSRFSGSVIHTNSQMGPRELRAYCKLDDTGQQMLKHAVYELGLSARAHDKILKIARTLADLSDRDAIVGDDIGQAVQYRRLDRNL